METKNYTQVLIDGKIYTLGGSEDEAYLQRTASYVNEKNMQLRGIPGFSKQSADYQQVMIQLNIADDYFKALDHSEQMEEERNRMEKESYSLKHELVSTQMKLEAVLKDLEERQVQLEETLPAPVEEGQRVGQLTVTSGGKTLAELALVADCSVARLSYWQILQRCLKTAFLAG